ncbi:hypothetical protein K431DRAFT_230703 [Polychaeton citri CBS 116435]|uniref:Uncharacterized protein n=1 Tax=Polychaeton citri CBS 116435 TaxID=1314669 RepID=A0A9P4UM50_9PEZI|nr:hypothetical protein K431DRAFT_230703 [Polychaeton citri CBS 116435]
MSIFEFNGNIQGERATETVHRRVELQSPADLHYLVNNLQHVAYKRLDKQFPSDQRNGQQDATRTKAESLIDEYIEKVFASAKWNISINGMHSEEMEAELAKAQEGEETEPFDAKLAQRVQALSAQIEHQTLQLANLRRTAPAETAHKFQLSFEKQSHEYEIKIAQESERMIKEAAETSMEIENIERSGELQETWQKSTGNLNALKVGIAGTITEMERAQKAAVLVTERY